MPLLQYKCAKCGEKFEELVKTYTDEVKWSAVRGALRARLQRLRLFRNGYEEQKMQRKL